MINVFRRVKAPPLWMQCVVASLAVHSAGLYFLAQHPILVKKSWALFSSSNPTPKHIGADEKWESDSLTLEHFFEEFAPPPKKIPLPSRSGTLSSLPLREQEPDILIDLPPSFLLKEKAISPMVPSLQETFFLPIENQEEAQLVQPAFLPPLFSKLSPSVEQISLDLTSKDEPLSSMNPRISAAMPSPNAVAPHSHLKATLSLLEERQGPSPSYFKDLYSSGQETFDALPLRRAPAPTFHQNVSFEELLSGAPLTEINDYLPSELISALEWNNDFDVKATIFPDEGGYVFSLSIAPKQNLRNQRIKQNFYFLIDASSDIERHKLSVFKRSVLKVLSSLDQEVSFNIFLLDKKATLLSPFPLSLSSKNMHLAEDFLEKGSGERSFFSSLNLPQALEELSKQVGAEDEVHTAILLSNGKSSLSPAEIRQLVEKNKGKFHLFTAAVGQNNQLASLDLLSSCCGGELFYSDTNAAFPRKLSLFIKSLEAPLAKDLTLSLHATHPKASIEMGAQSIPLPNLYNEEPLVIMGKLDHLCDLHLVLQGKNAEDQIFLKKVVHFEEAISPQTALKKAWLSHQKLSYYEKFLEESKPIYLKNAKEILKTIYGKALGE